VRTLLLKNSHEKKKINLVIRKNLQVNPVIKKLHVIKPPRSRNFRSTLQLGNTKKFNPAIKKKREKSPTIRKFSRKEEDQPYHREKSSSQPYN
jgi:hypothetical protein